MKTEKQIREEIAFHDGEYKKRLGIVEKYRNVYTSTAQAKYRAHMHVMNLHKLKRHILKWAVGDLD